MKSKTTIILYVFLVGVLGIFLVSLTTVAPMENSKELTPQLSDDPVEELDYLEDPVNNSVYFNFASALPAYKIVTYYASCYQLLRIGAKDCCIRDDIVKVYFDGSYLGTIDSRNGASGTHEYEYFFVNVHAGYHIITFENTYSTVGPSGWYYDLFANCYPVPVHNGPYIAPEGSTVTFSASGSFDPDSWITAYEWFFTGGHISVNSWPYLVWTWERSFTFYDDYSSNLRLKVYDLLFLSKSASTYIQIYNVAPTANAGSNKVANEGQEISFSGSCSDPGIYDTHTFKWNFGDGTTAFGRFPTHTYGDNGVYTVTLTVTDDDGGVGTDTLVVTVNNVNPTAVAGSDQTVNEGEEVYFSGRFNDPGWLDTHTYEWNFGDGTTPSYTLDSTHIYDDPGVYTVTLTVTDDDGGWGSDTLIITVLDKTPPVTSIVFEPYYEDEFGNFYVTSDTFFTLDVFEEFSGIAWTNYTINGEVFDYTAPFNIIGPGGTYVITFKSADTSDNVEEIDEDNEITVILVSLDIHSYLTDSEFNPITYFDFIFRKDSKLGGYTLVATNPGQFYYNIEITNDWPFAIDELTIVVNLPVEFILKGAMPIHVYLDYLDGEDITGLCDIDGTTITLTNIPSGKSIYVAIHMDFGLKGKNYDSLSDFILMGYTFETTASGSMGIPSSSGEGIFGIYNSASNLVGHQKKSTGICGFVTDINGDPRPNVIVYLYSENGFEATATTDENGFYYFINLELTTYYLRIGPIEDPIVIMEVIVKKDEFTEVNYSY